ncbi:hypothetical protein, partial [Marinimicrobium agarilyticum]|uniref:hypothetical protein n=1 Tax=Marinimicrobium agarilyticum TaxID=306546 RepID=UPI0005615E3C
MVANVRDCDFDPGRLVCEAGEGDSCISQAQAEALDIDVEDAQLRNDPMQARTDSYGWTNFSTFLNRGGKILFY